MTTVVPPLNVNHNILTEKHRRYSLKIIYETLSLKWLSYRTELNDEEVIEGTRE